MFPPVSHRALPSIVRRGRTPQIGAGAKNSPSSQTFANISTSVSLTRNRHFPFSLPLAEIPRNRVYFLRPPWKRAMASFTQRVE